MSDTDFDPQRAEMLAQSVAGRGVRSVRLLEALRRVPREAFVPAALREFAFEDVALPLGEGRTIPAPHVLALMIEAAAPGPADKVLEIAAGAGYATAVLARLADRVCAVEPLEHLAGSAAATLQRLGVHNAQVVHGEAAAGCPQRSPFDVIVVHPGAAHVPDVLAQQLAIGGQLVMPVGPDADVLELVRVTPNIADLEPLLARIGVIYRPETERQSHYFEAMLPRQFDEYIWFDETRAVTPLKTEEVEGMPDTYPFGV